VVAGAGTVVVVAVEEPAAGGCAGAGCFREAHSDVGVLLTEGVSTPTSTGSTDAEASGTGVRRGVVSSWPIGAWVSGAAG
jgi:hypothetical protein